MPLPTPEHDYQFAHLVNSAGATATESYKKTLLSVVQAMLTFPLHPWVCVASSNGVVANSSMNWNTTGDLVCSTSGACSWILVRQTGIAASCELLISLRAVSNTDGREARTSMSHTGGFGPLNSVSTVPTATNEYAVLNPVTYWFDDFSSAFSSSCDVLLSEDGSVTIWILKANGHSRAWHMFCAMSDPVTGVTDPSLMVRIGGAPPSSSVLLSTYFTGFHNFVAGMQAGTVSRFFLAGEAYNTTLLGRQNTRKNAVSGEYVMAPVGVVCDTNSIEGRHCHLPDVWIGPTDVLVPDGSYYPADGSKQFIQFGDFIFKWDGTTSNEVSGNDVDGYLCGFGGAGGTTPTPVTLSGLTPAAGSDISPTTPIEFSLGVTPPAVLGPAGLGRVIVWVTYPALNGQTEVAYDSAAFTAAFNGASRFVDTPSSGALTSRKFSILRNGGWPSSPIISVHANTNLGGLNS